MSVGSIHASIRAAFAMLLVALSGAHAAASDVTLTGDPWPPYVIGEIGTEAEDGIAVRLARRIFERIEGVTPRFPLIPWERALREVEAGTMDGIVILAKTPERERYMVYSDPLIMARNLVWYDARRFPEGVKWRSIDELSEYLIGVVRGYDYGAEVERSAAAGTLKLMRLNSVDQLFTMLAHGRLDLALANDTVGYALALDHAGDADIRATDTATTEDVYYMGLSRRSDAAKLVPKINAAIRDLRREGVTEVWQRSH